MVSQEETVVAQIPVGVRVVIHLVHHHVGSHAKLFHKFVSQIHRHKTFQNVAHKKAAHGCTTALIAEDIAARTHTLHNFLTIVEAGVGTGAENARKSWLMYQQTASGTHQVRVDTDRRLELGNK